MSESMTTQPQARKVIVGVDTHKHVHVAVAIDTWGIRLGAQSFVADSGGYQALITWAEAHGPIETFGIEGTGSYGASLAGAVSRAGHRVVEVNRGDRRTRRAAGKSDTVAAEVAARSVLAGQSTATPKTGDGAVEMMRQLKVARDTAVKARTTAMITLKQIVVHAPPPLLKPSTPSPITRSSLAAQDSDQAPLTRLRQPPSIPSGRSPAAGPPLPMKSRRTSSTSRDSQLRRRPPSERASGSVPTPRLRC